MLFYLKKYLFAFLVRLYSSAEYFLIYAGIVTIIPTCILAIIQEKSTVIVSCTCGISLLVFCLLIKVWITELYRDKVDNINKKFENEFAILQNKKRLELNLNKSVCKNKKNHNHI